MKIFIVITAVINIIVAIISYITEDMQSAIWHLGLAILLLQLEGKHEN